MPTTRLTQRPLLCLLTTLSISVSATAGTDISNRPLITNQVAVKPNLMFVLDNSGSMARAFVPEAMSDSGKYGYRSSQCNGAAYNPAATYPTPVTPDGRDYPAMPVAGAWYDGFVPAFDNDKSYSVSQSVNSTVTGDSTQITVTVTGWPSKSTPFTTNDAVALQRSGNQAQFIAATVTNITGSSSTRTVTLTLGFSSLHDGSHDDWKIGKLLRADLTDSGSFSPRADYYYSYTGSQTAMDWAYTSGGSADTSNDFVKECLSDHGSSPGSSKFTQVNVSSLDTAAKQNYANWFTYYRTRVLMMRSSAGRAIAGLDSSYRVGFSTLNNGSNFNSSVTDTLGLFSNIRDFDANQRVVFFSNLYGANVQGGTPLRRALVKAGQYYANDLSGQTDPVQHACQRNYTLLTSDGYWNDSNITPQRPSTLGGGSIGNQDGDFSDTTWTPRPVYDGSADFTRVERRYRYVTVSSCGWFSSSTKYDRILEERTVSSSTTSGSTVETDSGWSTISTASICGTVPSPNPSAITVQSSTGGGQSNTLADIAAYYYKTDLRPTMSNSVFVSETDPAKHQHMTTYTLGLGMSGYLSYDTNYLSQTSGDFADLKSGAKQWPTPPIDSSDNPAKIDDMWHAAVNGRGRYFSASDPQALTNSLSAALSDIISRAGVGAAAASSTLRPVLGTDQIFLGSYRTRFWDGELQARTITRLSDGSLSAGPANTVWSAGAQLTAMSAASRNILYLRHQTTATGVATSLGALTWANINSDADASTLLTYFNRYCDQATIPTQCTTLNATDQTAAKGENLVNFLRGDRTREGTLYRTRESLLGDIVDASPVYVGQPPFSYTGQNYPTYRTNNTNRCPMVYVAANDGMLHAFSAKSTNAVHSGCPTAGSEVWAYVPRAVMDHLYMLGDTNYADNHRFYVNATPIVGDISQSTNNADGTTTHTWSTILVGGLGAGGKGYYAVDVTSPASPSALWEFSDSDMGYSYGNPLITQITNADASTTWVVAFTSGLNNSGNGYLYILNARTGALLYKIPTLLSGSAVGTASTPSGLNKLNGWVDDPTYNLTERFYAGDMLGNLWRFDVDNLTPPAVGQTDTRAVRLANFTAGGSAQPITTRPELAEVSYGGYQHTVVLVGTGRYLGLSDLDTTGTQSIYGVKDPLTSTGWGNVRPSLIQQTLSAFNGTDNLRTVTTNSVDWNSATVAGWYIDLPTSGERVAVNMAMAYTTLSVASLIPVANVCSGDGSSWLYELNIATGGLVENNLYAGEKSDQAIMGISIVQVQDGDSTQTVGLNTKSTGETDFSELPNGTGGSAGLRRTSWRELLPPGQ